VDLNLASLAGYMGAEGGSSFRRAPLPASGRINRARTRFRWAPPFLTEIKWALSNLQPQFLHYLQGNARKVSGRSRLLCYNLSHPTCFMGIY
jgi:hypothetical protein